MNLSCIWTSNAECLRITHFSGLFNNASMTCHQLLHIYLWNGQLHDYILGFFKWTKTTFAKLVSHHRCPIIIKIDLVVLLWSLPYSYLFFPGERSYFSFPLSVFLVSSVLCLSLLFISHSVKTSVFSMECTVALWSKEEKWCRRHQSISLNKATFSSCHPPSNYQKLLWPQKLLDHLFQ